ncbi:twin transmembrane helix small protein [Paracoccus benzoatiresistens]|uniref:Twin transmembrane helix small protein n=1 Tax=Paracoccus benzoatiresistens TaxID=2997341 RepID=A0ABT4J2R9_9RHOB|nr:twin transmembrane helix small protein [Paracoccus sp. EF6]MCZ0961414.1 twin transmembrane helix small protein [Paracoccus sp. EF6]
MTDEPLFYVIALAMLAVLVILATGIGGFAKGGEWNRRHGNRMMRWRLIAQAIAVALIMLFVWLGGR